MDTAITALLNSGADAMDNLFDVEITFPTDVTSDDTATKATRLRCLGFDPPPFKIKTYDVRYKTIKVKKPAAVMEGDRTFKIQFRLDANYDVYLRLASWRAKTLIPSLGYAGNNLPSSSAEDLGEIKIYTLAEPTPLPDSTNLDYLKGVSDGASVSEGSTLATSWEFKQVWLIDLTEPSYKYSGGDPITITATFAFGEYRDPYHAKMAFN